jgi:lipoprotein NlpI
MGVPCLALVYKTKKKSHTACLYFYSSAKHDYNRYWIWCKETGSKPTFWGESFMEEVKENNHHGFGRHLLLMQLSQITSKKEGDVIALSTINIENLKEE